MTTSEIDGWPKPRRADPIVEVPLLVRGRVIDGDDYEFAGRRGNVRFVAPNPVSYLDIIGNDRSSSLSELHALTTDQIATFLADVGRRLNPDTNAHMRDALEASLTTSGLHPPSIHSVYRTAPGLFTRKSVLEIADRCVGIDYLDGWVPAVLDDGRTASIRAFGARGVHIIAGNIPIIAFLTIIRSAITRSDSIIKLPSNDPLTASAIVRTMIDLEPDHPVTRSLTVAYWKGGDAAFEEKLYRPRFVEKIVAWGGLASVKHISRYLQPGIDLITLDPKQSMTVIGSEALQDEATMRLVARRAACDVAAYNQEMCANARVIYLVSGTCDEGIAAADRFAKAMYEEMLQLPESLTGPSREFDQELRMEVEALDSQEEWYSVHCGRHIDDAGGVIVSRLGEPVDFARQLANRVANVVPVDNVDTAIRSVNASTQTVGIYPDSLKDALRDRLSLAGVQMLISLGYVATLHPATPQDAIEPMRRMCRWVVDHQCSGAVPEPWSAHGTAALT